MQETQPDHDLRLASSHLQAAHQMYQQTLAQREALTFHEAQSMEAYTIRTAINCLFQPDVNLPFDYVAQLLGAHQDALGRLSLEVNPHNSARIYILGSDMINNVYKLSWLNRRRPLRGNLLVEGVKCIRALASWGPLELIDADPNIEQGRNTLAVLTYRCACLSLADDIVNEDLPRNQRDTKAMSVGMQALDRVTSRGVAEAVFSWPLIILGAQAVGPETQTQLADMLARLRTTASAGTVSRIERFWNSCWRTNLSRSVFSNAELLKTILL